MTYRMERVGERYVIQVQNPFVVEHVEGVELADTWLTCVSFSGTDARDVANRYWHLLPSDFTPRRMYGVQ